MSVTMRLLRIHHPVRTRYPDLPTLCPSSSTLASPRFHTTTTTNPSRSHTLSPSPATTRQLFRGRRTFTATANPPRTQEEKARHKRLVREQRKALKLEAKKQALADTQQASTKDRQIVQSRQNLKTLLREQEQDSAEPEQTTAVEPRRQAEEAEEEYEEEEEVVEDDEYPEGAYTEQDLQDRSMCDMMMQNQQMSQVRKLAKSGSRFAQSFIGMLYMMGSMGFKQDDVLARKWLQRAADQQDYEGLYYAGLMCSEGKGGPLQLEKAKQYWSFSASKGHLDGMFAYASILLTGNPSQDNIEADEERAVEWLHKAAERDHPEAILQLARIYSGGLVGSGERKEEAQYWYDRAEKHPELADAFHKAMAENEHMQKEGQKMRDAGLDGQQMLDRLPH